MTDRIGRNDPCPCGSGKKFKQCCLSKKGGSGVRKQLKAVWLNQPAKEQVNLIERTFGDAIAAASAHEKPPQIPEAPEEPSVETDDKQ